MITEDRLRECADTSFPWKGTTKSRQVFHRVPLLSLLFRAPSYFNWARTKAATWEGGWLRKEMDLLLSAVATIRPTALCRQGNPLRYWSLYRGLITGHYVFCAAQECRCRATGGEPEEFTIVPHTFAAVIPRLEHRDDCDEYCKWFKRDYGLPDRYSHAKYLGWLLENADLAALDA